MKIRHLLIALVSIWYLGDAIYPSWDWNCTGHKGAAGLWIGPAKPKAFDDNDSRRAINPDRPRGCTLRADNIVRRAYDWIAV